MNGIRMMFLLGLLSASVARADGVSLEPGLWEMRFSMKMPMLSDPQERTFTDCVEETTFDPEDFQMDEDSGCSTSSPEVDGGTISWSMECSGPMGPSSGTWSFTSNGDSMQGEGKMVSDLGGQQMEISMSWSGERLGDCD